MQDNFLKIKKILGIRNIKKNDKFLNIQNWDSLAHMQFILNLEKTFKIKLKNNDLIKIDSIQSTLNIIKKYENKKK